MNHVRSRRRSTVAAIAVGCAVALAVAGCSAAEPEPTGSPALENVELTLLVQNDDLGVKSTEALVAAFTAEHPNITIDIETRPAGAEGNNVVKTRVATDDITDIFSFNSGANLQTLNPAKTLLDLTDTDFIGRLTDNAKSAVTVDGASYGVPYGTANAGGFLYNTAVYDELGLKVPETWKQLIANSKAIKAAGKVPIIETFGTSWTSQLILQGDLYNILAEQPDWAERYTANKVNYSNDERALQGFEHMAEIRDDELINTDYASATVADGLRLLATGEGVQYPILTNVMGTLMSDYPDAVNDIGFFSIPGDRKVGGTTIWMPNAYYISATSEHPEEAKAFLDFVASAAGCDALTAATAPTAPYVVDGCDLPDDVIPVANDLARLMSDPASTTALSFLSPVNGPNQPNILIAVGSGITSPEDGAKQHYEDAKKQAEQLNLPGW